jgi:hypothetical protein
MQTTFGIAILVIVMAAAIGGLIYGVHRLTAPAALRGRLSAEANYLAGMAARGRTIALPRTWRSEGLEGHDRRMMADSRLILTRALPLVAGVYVVFAVTGDQAVGDLVWQFLLAAGVFVLMLLGLRIYVRRHVSRTLHEAAMVPRTAFNIVANEHGLFLPVADGRTLSGAWGDWIVTDVGIVHGRYGIDGCERVTLAHRNAPDVTIPLITSTMTDGAALMDTLVARVERASAA